MSLTLYELAVLGEPVDDQLAELEAFVSQMLASFSLELGREVSWEVKPSSFSPSQRRASAALFFGAPGVSDVGLAALLDQGISVIPVVSGPGRFSTEVPPALHHFNGLVYTEHGPQRIGTALLECAGLLPRQRRVFISYRRQDARGVALQLFDAFSARQFDVFLDTHGIPPADDFQATLWQRLCESDVLVMIDTPGYFDSRWTAAEFGRALAKSISVLRVGWPGCERSPRAIVAGTVDLSTDDVDHSSGVTSEAIERICRELEARRSESIAVRHLNLVGQLRQGVQVIGGTVRGVGLHRSIHISLADGNEVVAYATTGMPTALTLQDAAENAHGRVPAIVYDHVGLHDNYLRHLSWLTRYVKDVQLVRACEIAWDMADWRH